jgi:hypothetical protein
MKHFITYGSGPYEKAKERLYKEAVNTGWFDHVKPYGFNDLTTEFKENYKDILSMSRGGGYWIWKIDIIEQQLNLMEENDILVYCDAGCSINIKGVKRFNQYYEMLNNSNKSMITFSLSYFEHKYNTKKIFEYFNATENEKNSYQSLNGVLIIKKCNDFMEMLSLYKKALNDDPLMFTDYYNNNDNGKDFIDNRHDQSVFSIIKKRGKNVINLKCEVECRSLKCPFWATRLKK